MGLSQCYRIGLIGAVSIILIILGCLYAGFYINVDDYFVFYNIDVGHHESMTENVQIVQQEFHLNTRHSKIVSLPKDVIDGVKTFVLFLGHAHSGHSIVGSLLDAHPHMVIAHEANVFEHLSKGTLEPKKVDIFNAIWRNTVKGTVHGKRVTPVKGYSLLVQGLYEGKYVDHIDVIGDKKAGTTTSLLLTRQQKFLSSLETIKSFVDSVKVIHVIRNPYDNIATSVIYAMTSSREESTSIKESKEIFKTHHETVHNRIKRYFAYYKAIEDVKKLYNLDYIEVHGKDLVSDARGTISRMCDGLGVFCSDSYLDVCSDKVFKSESKTRYKIEWDKGHLDEIQRNIDEFSSLNGYTFDS
ncbi:uncharacterized protein [Dysidea avara]|uniref:uncharacterized protein n=1 Tax=Dysidea avara TaxID=196820 RepID=UPI003325B3C8